jgi:beta-lactamase superfamily II metal-dependent hydrolase
MAVEGNDVEIVVLGKGVGESVLVRLGSEWLILDSFRAESGRPAPIDYLHNRGVQPSSVVAVVLTHFHADHCHGIEEVVMFCENAWFYVPAAVTDAAWERVIRASEENQPARARDNVIATAVSTAAQRKRLGVLGLMSLLPTAGHEVFAIAPTRAAQLAARGSTSPLVQDPKAAINNPNFSSIVLWIRAGKAIALLGADLDLNSKFGWEGSVAELDSSLSWMGQAGFVKASHHGSTHGHDEAALLVLAAKPLVVITPNTNSHLPDFENMVPTIKAMASTVWIAGPSAPRPAMGEAGLPTPQPALGVEAVGSRLTGLWSAGPAERELV